MSGQSVTRCQRSEPLSARKALSRDTAAKVSSQSEVRSRFAGLVSRPLTERASAFRGAIKNRIPVEVS